MRCKVAKVIFRNKENGFSVVACRTQDTTVPQSARSPYYKGDAIVFTAVGYQLPDKDTLELELNGRWVNGKRGMQYQVESFDVLRPQTREGIIGYLSSGMVKGIGIKTAERIVDKFGARTFEVMDQYPDSLLEIKGITRAKLDTILSSYRGSYILRDLATHLTPFGITPGKIQKIYDEYGEHALDIVKNQPYLLCRISGFGFLTVDEIAKAGGCALNDSLRIEGCIGYCFEQEMQDGHVYLDKSGFQKRVYEQLNAGYREEVVSEREVYAVLYRMVKEQTLCYEDGALYQAKQYAYECGAAKDLVSLMMEKDAIPMHLEELIQQAQEELGITLSEKQKEAVKKAFLNKVTIITGGPGTGKTTVLKVLLYIHERTEGGNVLLTAPTGRASRRMAESTGYDEACTMHSALGLTGDEEAEDNVLLDASFIIADEFTMADMALSYQFFHRIRRGARLILVGDVNQLPSVGPGNVFRELILSGIIPTTELDMVFRQKENSRISMNAHRMQENQASLDYGEDFVLYPATRAEEAADTIASLYMDLVKTYGLEQVQVLSPFRKRGDASVDHLNDLLWNMVNPKGIQTGQIKAGGQTFRVGDKVIHTKNKNGISNGDVGFITKIYPDEDGTEYAKIAFTGERFVEYTADELDMVEHSYATTVHKSQGSEYSVVILPWIPMFYNMLRRNIFYTAVTRAREKVILVGDKRSIYAAIHNTACNKRNTRLAERITREYNKRNHQTISRKIQGAGIY